MDLEWGTVLSVISNMVAPLSGIIGVVVGHVLSRGHNRKEKIRDLRRAAYGAILSELSAAQPFYDAAADRIAEDPHYYHSSDAWDRHYRQINDHMVSARNCFEREYLTLSEAFIDRYEAMMLQKAHARDEADPFANVEAYGAITRSARIDLMKIARNEVAS